MKTKAKAKKTVRKAKTTKKKVVKPKVEKPQIATTSVAFTDEELQKMALFGTGIPMPMLSYRFIPEFLDASALKPLEENVYLVGQMIKTSDVSSNGRKAVELHFVDDIENKTFNAIQALRNKVFTLKIAYVDGNEKALRTHYIKNARIVDILYGELDYASSSSVLLKAVVSYSGVAVV